MRSTHISGVTLLFVCLSSAALLHATSGLQCYGCAKNEQSGRSCEDFKDADDTERKTRFAITCSSSATGCAYMKFNIDNDQAKFVSESLECYVPDAKLVKISEMNACVDTVEGRSMFKVCACDGGNFCLDGAASPRHVGGGIALLLLIPLFATAMQ